jgi:broad specificity phosphatase PhoE
MRLARGFMTTRLDLVAHGASSATRAARFPEDEGIEAASIVTLEGLSGRLRPYDRVLTAPARAARETAAALGLDADVETALRDCDHGRWRGLALSDVAVREANGYAAWLGDPAAAPHGGESLTAVIERTGAWLGELLLREGATLAVTHSSVVRAAIVSALGVGPLVFWRVDVAPLSLARLSGREGRWNLVALGPLGARS